MTLLIALFIFVSKLRFSRESVDRQTDGRTNGRTDATKYIISLASRSINIFVIYHCFNCKNCKDISFFSITMNGYRASGLRKKYSGPPLHGSPVPDQKDMTPKGDFRQASHKKL